jgi:cytochrome c2
LGTRYNTLPWPTEGRYGHHDGAYEKPIYAWLPSIATSGLTEIRGFHEAWDGDLLVSTFASRGLSRVRIVDGRALFAEEISIGERIRYVQQHTDGRIALWTDSSKVMLLSPAKAGYGNDYIESRIENLSLAERESSELRKIVEGCLECHDLSGSYNGRPSSLAMMHGKPLGDNAISSPALRAAGGQWTQANLSDFIKCPECIVPGTFMANQDLSSGQADNVASLLKMFAEDFQ